MSRAACPGACSESGFAVTDRLGQYQYKAFGVPGLGMKRGLADELVIAPYATALAAQVDARRRARQLRAARPARRRGSATASTRRSTSRRARPSWRRRRWRAHRRQPSEAVVVRAYLAHHQGMTIGAIANVLDACSMTRRFHADPRVQATELLLQERVPRGLATQNPRPAEETRVAVAAPSLSYATLPLAPHRSSARALPLERRLYRDRHQRRRRRLSVPGARGDAAARGSRRATRAGLSMLPPRRARRLGLVAGLSIPRTASRRSTSSPSCRRRRPSAACRTTSSRCSRLRSRPRTTSRCAA